VCQTEKKSYREAKEETSYVAANDLFKVMFCFQLFFLFSWQENQVWRQVHGFLLMMFEKISVFIQLET
jgi:hypothetical protein